MKKKKTVLIIIACVVFALVLALVIMHVTAKRRLQKIEKQQEEYSSYLAQKLLSFDECDELTAIINQAIDFDPDANVTVHSDVDKVTVSCYYDPMVIGYQTVLFLEPAVPVLKDYLLIRDIPFELSLSGFFYENGDTKYAIIIETDDLTYWDITDTRSNPVYIRKSVSYDDIIEYFNK